MSAANALPAQINSMDPRALADLKRLARDDSPEGLKAAAEQFESMFLQMVMKSMRDATPSGGMLDSDQGKMYQSMLDQQLSTNMARTGGVGLADAIVRQLGGQAQGVSRLGSNPLPMGHGGTQRPAAETSAQAAATAQTTAGDGRFSLAGVHRFSHPPTGPAQAALVRERGLPAPERAGVASDAEVEAFFMQFVDGAAPAGKAAAAGVQVSEDAPAHVREFIETYLPYAEEASRSTGIPAHFMVAQAALETGWGRAVLRTPDGGSSHNLFNIKASRGWDGEVATTVTTEYAGGRAYSERARFRAYDSPAESFKDYAQLLLSSPRYAEVLGQQDPEGFARSLQQSGYATDPAYADKLARIIASRFIEPSSRA